MLPTGSFYCQIHGTYHNTLTGCPFCPNPPKPIYNVDPTGPNEPILEEDICTEAKKLLDTIIRPYHNRFSFRAGVMAYHDFLRDLQKQPETMGKELEFKCIWTNRSCDEYVISMQDDEGKSCFTVFKGVFGRLVFDGDRIRELAAARKALQYIFDHLSPIRQDSICDDICQHAEDFLTTFPSKK